MRKNLDDLKRDEAYYLSQLKTLDKRYDDNLLEMEEIKRQMDDYTFDLKEAQEDIDFIEGALAAGIPMSVIQNKSKLTDHFSQNYIDMQCNRAKVDQDETE